MSGRTATDRSAVVHIGVSKTATGTLQRNFFPRLPGCRVMSRFGPGGSPMYVALSRNLRSAPNGEYAESTVRAYVEDQQRRAEHTLVWTDETLSGGTWRGIGQPEVVAERIHRLLPEARILVCVRNQASRIRSLYSYYVITGGYRSFSEFLEEASPGHVLALERLEYDTLVVRYRELFGAERVHVVLFEDLRADADGFLRDLTSVVQPSGPVSIDAASLPVRNSALSGPSQSVMRVTNRLFRKTIYNQQPWIADLQPAHDLRRYLAAVDRRVWPGSRAGLSDADEQLLESLLPRFEASNAALADLTGLELADAGYPMPRLHPAVDGAAPGPSR